MSDSKTVPFAASQEDERQFETVLSELEAHVNALEAGDVPLEEALALFENGIRLSRESQQLLDNAEQKIIELTEKKSQTIEKNIPVGPNHV